MKFPVEQILNLPGMKVLNCQEIEGLGFIVEIEADCSCCTCPSCCQVSRSIHQNHLRIIQDLPWSTSPVLLRINRRQFKCNNCQKVFSEDLDFVDKQRGYTKRLASDIVQQVLDSKISSVAKRNDLSEEQIASMLDAQASSRLEIDLSLIKRLAWHR